MPEKRRRRNRHRSRGPEPAGTPAAAPPPLPTPHDERAWQWRTFPVGFAFALGALIMGLLVWLAPGAFYVFLIGAFFLTMFGVAHYFGRSFREYRAGNDER